MKPDGISAGMIDKLGWKNYAVYGSLDNFVLPETFTASPNEWYKWEKDISENPDITILISVDSSGFPLGTGPKPHEIWHSGYYPMVWTNKNYKILYINMGHNIIDYENKTSKELSFTFENESQNRLITDGLLWLGR